MANCIQRKRDVFLSFRGKDTRNGFTSHLLSALSNAQVETFKEDNSLERGEQLSPSLQKAIEESKVSVIIFSQNYAGSQWCLDELVEIMKCKKEQQQIVVPVFYEVEPSNVRHQTETYKDAFKKHEERYKEDKNKLRKWREALTEAANLSGLSSRNSSYRDESQLIKAIVEDILTKLNRMSPIEGSNMVGIDSRFKKVESLLCMEDFQSIRMVGIWGMWGSGKTAIARAVFSRLHTLFEGYYFLANVKEELKRHDALVLRSRIVSSLLGEHNKINLNMPDSNMFVKDRLGRKRVLVVLDDVDDPMQLENLLGGNHDKFGGGSRILITTRDRKVLHGHVADGEIYEVERLSHYQALELFSLSAFGQNYPPADYMDMSIKVVDYCDSNPLALKDLGSSLRKKTIEEWQSALRTPYLNPHIQTLISSYDGLSIDEKHVFLDIACFFRGEDRSRIVNVLESCYPSANFIISRLQDRCLITTTGNKMEMSLLIQNLGWSVVHEAELEKYSRLRNCEELKKPKRKKAIESIFLDISENEKLDLEADVFKEMDRLRLLKFFVANSDKDNKLRVNLPLRLLKFFKANSDKYNDRRVNLPNGLNSLSDTLRYIHWHRFPLNSMPKSFSAKHLVELILPFSKIKKLGLGKEIILANLKRIDLSHSRHLRRIPELSRAENVQIIILRGCKRLVELPKSVQHLHHLEHLDLSFCKDLDSLPGRLDSKNLKFLDLSYCSNIKNCPEISGKLELLDLSGAQVKKLPSSIQYSESLRVLRLAGNSKFSKYPVTLITIDKLFPGQCKIKDLSSSTQFLTRLVELELVGNTLAMRQSQAFFGSLNNLVSLNRLALKQFDFESLPCGIRQLPMLQFLSLSNCKRLQSIKELPSSLEMLQADECSSLDSLFTNGNLRHLNLANCFMLDMKKHKNIIKDALFIIHHVSSKSRKERHQVQFLFPGSEVPEFFYDRSQEISETKQLPMDCDQVPLLFPGSEVPEFFYDRSQEISVTKQLPTDCDQFKGIAFCVAFGLHESLSMQLRNMIKRETEVFLCKFSIKVQQGDELKLLYDSQVSYEASLVRSDHVLIWYNPCTEPFDGGSIQESYWLKPYCGQEASFEFSITTQKSHLFPIQLIVKQCGIRLLQNEH